MLPSNFAVSGLPIKVSKAAFSCEGLSVDAWTDRSARSLPSPLWPRIVTRHANGFYYLPLARRLEGNLPPLLKSPLQYKLHSSKHFLQSAGHAVLGTLYSRAHRIGLNEVSCLLDGLRKNVSLSSFVVVVICVYVCPASEVIVFAEQQFQGFGDHVRR
jgi:hypothetical protein